MNEHAALWAALTGLVFGAWRMILKLRNEARADGASNDQYRGYKQVVEHLRSELERQGTLIEELSKKLDVEINLRRQAEERLDEELKARREAEAREAAMSLKLATLEHEFMKLKGGSSAA